MTTPALLTSDPVPRLSLNEWRTVGSDPLDALSNVSFQAGQRLLLGSHHALRGATLTLPSLESVYGSGGQGGVYGYQWGRGWVEVDGAMDWLIEDCVFDFGSPPRYSHQQEKGYNAIWVKGGASHGIIRRCRFKNIDSAIILTNSHHITVEDCIVEQPRKSWQADPTYLTGHYGVCLGTGAHHTLVSRVRIDGRLMHDISVQGASYNVVEDCMGTDLNFDHHRRNPHHNLFTGCTLGAGTRPYASSGKVEDGASNGDWEVFWGNYKTGGGQTSVLPNFANGYWTKRLVIIGQTQNAQTTSAEWYEAIPNADLTPRNLYRHLVGGTPPPPPPPPPISIEDRIKAKLMATPVQSLTAEEAEYLVP